MSAAPLSDTQFMELVEQMLTTGGEWRLSMSKGGITLYYRGELHNVTEKHANVMFQHVPRKCADSAAGEQPLADGK